MTRFATAKVGRQGAVHLVNGDDERANHHAAAAGTLAVLLVLNGAS